MKKKQIREGVFETNSSSTHSICIAKNAQLELPKELHFEFGEFGWEQNTLDSLQEKASYLYTGLIAEKRKKDADKIFKILKSKDIKVTSEKAVRVESTHTKGYFYYENSGYVDHSDRLKEFHDAICSDENKLMNYLFSPLSFIKTGNDNDPSDINWKVDYEHDEYYKGN